MLIRTLPHMLSKMMFQHCGNPMLETAGMLVVLHWEFPLSSDLLSCHSNNRCKRRNCTNGLLMEALQMLKFSLKCNYWSSHPASECQWCKWGYLDRVIAATMDVWTRQSSSVQVFVDNRYNIKYRTNKCEVQKLTLEQYFEYSHLR